MSGDPGVEVPACAARRCWIVTLLAVVAVAAMVVGWSLRREETADQIQPLPPDAEAAPATVQLHIDFGDGVQKRFMALPWHDGMTVADVLESASRRRRGIQYSSRGVAGGAFLAAIDGLENEGGGADGRNWLYRVNGVKADRSFAVYPLKPADTVLWTFTTYD